MSSDYRDIYTTKSRVYAEALKHAMRRHASPNREYEQTANEVRASWGEAAVMFGCPDYATGGNGITTDITDALSNIAHFCDRAGVNVEDVFAAGIRSYHGDSECGPPCLPDPERYPDAAK